MAMLSPAERLAIYKRLERTIETIERALNDANHLRWDLDWREHEDTVAAELLDRQLGDLIESLKRIKQPES